MGHLVILPSRLGGDREGAAFYCPSNDSLLPYAHLYMCDRHQKVSYMSVALHTAVGTGKYNRGLDRSNEESHLPI